MHARSAAAAAEKAGGGLAQAWADCRLAQVSHQLGEMARASELFERAEAVSVTLGAPDLQFSILHNRAWFVVDALLSQLPQTVEQMTLALQRLERAQKLAESLGNVHSQGICLLNRSRLLMGLDNAAQSQELARRAAALGHEHALTQLFVGAQAVCVEWMLRQGQVAEALDTLQDLSTALPEADLIGHIELQHLRVKAHRQRGEFEQALNAFEALHALSLRQTKARASLQTWAVLHQDEVEAERTRARRAEADADRMRGLARQWELEAHIDPLTGLGNRRAMQASLPGLLSAVGASRQPPMAVILDLDHFKKINDRHGHDVGDQVLRTIGQMLRTCIRPGDLAARLGGEEFLLLLPDVKADQAFALCERLRNLIAAHDWSVLADGLQVTISLGLAAVEAGEAPWNAADQALYRAKAAGRNRTELG